MKIVKNLALALVALIWIGLALTACSSPAAAEVDVVTYSYDAGEFVTNVKDSKKILSCTATVDVISETLVSTLAEKDYIVKDTINKRLRQLTEQDLESADIEATLSESLVGLLNEALETKGFYQVYFIRFVYQ